MMELERSEQKQLLFDLIYEMAFTYTKDLIPLASGIKTDYYFDIKLLTGDPESSKIACAVLYDEIVKIGDVKSVGGLESGAIPIAHGISDQSLKNITHKIYSFYVRKKPKDTGLNKWIEGKIEDPVVVVDDVITGGNSAKMAIERIKEHEHKPKHLFTLVYRGNEEQKIKFEKENDIQLHYIFSSESFKIKYENEHHVTLTN